MTGFRFASTVLLWGLAVVPILFVLFLWGERKRRRDLARWFHEGVWTALARAPGPGRRKVSWILFSLSVGSIVVGAARPQLGTRILETRQRGSDVVIAMDLSLSMRARDVQPSRLDRARQEVLTLLDRLQGDRIALVAFSGEAFLQCPLTLDRGAIRMLLPLLEPEQMPVPGTNLEAAVARALEAFQDDPRRGRAVIIVSDGEAFQGEAQAVIDRAKEAKVRICAIGIGGIRGEPIPVASGSQAYKKDRSGQVVLTRLEEGGLRALCEGTGGTYVRAESGMASGRVAQALRDLEQTEMEGGLGIRYEERFAYFAGLALLLLVAETVWMSRRLES
jgi:Ca-activated chloride channel family protein